ncbi:MAG: phosphoadenylyl-sulfate reductase [Gammaproteobacteria bacterium]
MSQVVAADDLDAAIEPIRAKLAAYRAAGKRMFATSSFQSHSLPLLHILSRLDNSIPVYFTNTGFLFPETLAFADRIAEEFGIRIIGLKPLVPKIHQLDHQGHLYFASDPDYCCFLNKVQPLEPVLMSHDVWINGIRGDQNDNRKAMREEERAPHGALRYHPMLNWTARMIHAYGKRYRLRPHPLESAGYLSIGCEPCTTKFLDDGNERNSRWFGMNKTECGLHTELVQK